MSDQRQEVDVQNPLTAEVGLRTSSHRQGRSELAGDVVARTCRRLAEPASRRLEAALRGLVPQPSPALVDDWTEQLVGRLAEVLGDVLWDELRVRRAVLYPFGLIPIGSTKVVDALVAEVSAPGRVWLLKRYPEAARLVDCVLRNWLSAALRLHSDLEHDRPALQALGVGVADPVARVQPGLGDSHQGGRTVTLVRFRSGHRVVYKPRSVSAEQALGNLVSATAAACGDDEWRQPVVCDRRDHGWMEFIESSPASDQAQVHRYFRRAGLLLAVCRAIGASDLHSENIIARGDAPIVIDAETLMPARIKDPPDVPLDPAVVWFRNSVLATNLLPRPIPVFRQRFVTGPPALVELGGFGTIGQTTLSDFGWDGADDNQTRHLRATSASPARNLAVLDGQHQHAKDYVQDIVTGYVTACQALLVHRGQWLAGGALSDLTRAPIRSVPRNTSAYAAALRRSVRRSCLQDPARRRQALVRRLGESTAEPGEQLQRRELEALDAFDIPYFSVSPDSTHLADTIELVAAPADQMLAHLEYLNAAELDEQVEIIRASLDPAPNRLAPTVPRRSAKSPTAPDPTIAQPLAADLRRAMMRSITDIAQSLVATALSCTSDGTDLRPCATTDPHDPQRPISWAAVLRDAPTATEAIAALPAGLMTGTHGIVLFLLEAGRLLHHRQWSDVGTAALTTATGIVQHQLSDKHPHSGAIPDIGMADGLGGLLWTLGRLRHHHPTLDVTSTAAPVLAAIHAAIPEVRRFDFDGGLSGAVLGLLSWYDATASPQALQLATQCGELLTEHVTNPAELVPFTEPVTVTAAFGCAGPVQALAALTRRTHDPRWSDHARTLLNNVDEGPHGADQEAGADWERGEAGRLAALLAVQSGDQAASHPDVAASLARLTTAAKLLTIRHEPGLRRGTAGIVDVLRAARQCPAVAISALIDPHTTQQPNHHRRLRISLGDGSAGVGLTLLRVLHPTACRSPLIDGAGTPPR